MFYLVMIRDITTFVFIMRTNGTKYDTIKELTGNPMPVTAFANELGTNPAYICVKYDRYKFGYINRKGQRINAPYPGYDIYCWNGMNIVIPAKNTEKAA